MRKAILTIALGWLCMSITTGCATWTTTKPKSKSSKWSAIQFWRKPFESPTQLAAIWTPDTLTMSGKPPTRGFGGRIYFYNADSKAIPVEGELIVHGYEESKVAAKDVKREADKKFVFTQEQFTAHYSPSELGASYSVWIPWDGAEGMQREICLIPTFKSSDGAVTQGEPAKLVLQGRTMDPLTPQTSAHISFQQSESPTVQDELPIANRMRTTTISLPSRSSRLTSNSTKRTELPSQSSGVNTSSPLGGVAVGVGNAATASESGRMTTIVNDLNSTLPSQRSYSLNANLTSSDPQRPTQIMPQQSAFSATGNNMMGNNATGNNATRNNGMPAVQPASSTSPAAGQNPIYPANFQSIVPPQLPNMHPNQAAAPAMPQALPTHNPQTYGQMPATQAWQPFGHPAIPLIPPAQNTVVMPASGINQGFNQVQNAAFSGTINPNAVSTAWGQFPVPQPGQQVPPQLQR